MSVPDFTRFDELLSRYLDSSLNDAEEHELLQYLADENLAARFHEATQLDIEIAGVLAGNIPDEVMVGLVWSDLGLQRSSPVQAPTSTTDRTSRKQTSGILLVLAAMVVFLLIATAIYFAQSSNTIVVHAMAPDNKSEASAPVASTGTNTQPEPPAGQIASMTGEVSFVDASGNVSLAAGQVLKEPGKIKTAGPDSRAALTLADGSQINLLGNTTFSVDFTDGKRDLFLEHGAIRVAAAKQAPNTALVFQTSFMTVKVHGTEFAMVAADWDGYLVVYSGTVGVQQSLDDPETKVEGGQFVHVEQSMDFLRALPMANLPQKIQDQIGK